MAADTAEEDDIDRTPELSKSSEFNYGPTPTQPPGPTGRDHLPIEEQLKYYAKRDLRPGKIAKIAREVWKVPMKRKRVHFAPPMDPVTHGKSPIANTTSSKSTDLSVGSPIPFEEVPSEAEVAAKEYRDEFENYKDWIAERKKFRNDLDNMGVSAEWLSRKPNKTPLEKQLLQKMTTKTTPPVAPAPKTEIRSLDPDPTKHIPIVRRPVPRAVQLIEKFLHQKKKRLIDLFSSVDKMKTWKVTRAAFRTAIQQAGIPISDIMLEDLILALDMDLNDELDYRELAKGMSLWKLEKREDLKSGVNQSSSKSNVSHHLAIQPPVIIEDDSSTKDVADGDTTKDDRSKSAASTSSVASTRFLTPPPFDKYLAEGRPFSSAEARVDHRKIERHLLKQHQQLLSGSQAASQKITSKSKGTHTTRKRQPIKTGNTAVDQHSQLSTLSDETGLQVDKFRQLKIKEYYEIIRLCKDNNIALSEKLLARVLLHPPDKPRSALTKKIRQPGQLIDIEELTHSEKSITVKKQKKQNKSNRNPEKNAYHQIGSSSSKEQQHLMTNVLILNHKGNNPEGLPTEGQDMEYSNMTNVHKDHSTQESKKEIAREKKMKSLYRRISEVAPATTKMYLSTGKALVHRQVDCWMSFEEYDKLTRHLAHKYHEIHGPTDDNAFWPGHLLDKMRLCMPGGGEQNKKESNFQIIKREKPVYPLLGHKPVLAYS